MKRPTLAPLALALAASLAEASALQEELWKPEAAGVAALPGSRPGSATCKPTWTPTFGGQPGMDGSVHSLLSVGHGSNAVLYAGGEFRAAGGQAASGIARWDGSRWSRLTADNPPAFGGAKHALALFNDGTGRALYVGGAFTNIDGITARRIARLRGKTWEPLGNGMNLEVNALASFDDGSGPALYAGGRFTSAGAVLAPRVARWDGSAWSQVGSGFVGVVHALATFDDGSGPALYAGGALISSAGVPLKGVARWDGTSWSPVGDSPGSVRSFAVFDDGSGPALFAVGQFAFGFANGSVLAYSIAKWDGNAWSPVPGLPPATDGAYSMAVFDDGSGPALYVGGAFPTADGTPVHSIAKWDGAVWLPVGSGVGGDAPVVRALAVYDGPAGPELFAGGDFTEAGGDAALRVARWSGSAWSPTGTGLGGGVAALSTFDDGGGPALFAGGAFTRAGSVELAGVGRWDGTGWTSLGSGVDGEVRALAAFDDGGGSALHAGGSFTQAGGVSAGNLARFDGTAWSALGAGTDGEVRALLVFDDGGGPALFAGGSFANAGGTSASNVARWDGTSWTPLGAGVDGPVNALVVFDSGSGPALYAGGSFAHAGGVPASAIARWDGSSWSPLGSGLGSASPPSVRSLAVLHGGAGPELVAGGSFTQAGGAPASQIASWNGSQWWPLAGLKGEVTALLTVDDGTGSPLLYAGGGFNPLLLIGTVGLGGVARWNGLGWAPVGRGTTAKVEALATFDDGSGTALFAGGAFAVSASGDSFLAKWGCPP